MARRLLTAKVHEEVFDIVDAWAQHLAVERNHAPSRSDAIEYLTLRVPPPESLGPTQLKLRTAYRVLAERRRT